MAEPRYPCATCGTWQCDACGWKRSQASLSYEGHFCGRCPSRTGAMAPTMHTELMWRRHNGYDGELPESYAYGERPSSLRVPCTSAVGPEFYRGVRVPKQGPYQRFDLVSWKRGVDDCLKKFPTEEGERDERVQRPEPRAVGGPPR